MCTHVFASCAKSVSSIPFWGSTHAAVDNTTTRPLRRERKQSHVSILRCTDADSASALVCWWAAGDISQLRDAPCRQRVPAIHERAVLPHGRQQRRQGPNWERLH